MPRPHPLPRRAPEPTDDPFPPFKLVQPMRVLSSLNVRRDEKALFDAYQMWLSYREGRSIQQWEAFAFLMRCAFENHGHPLLHGFRLPKPPEDSSK